MPAYDDDGFDPPAAIATIVIRHPEREASISGVRMLMDSGADATLLPRFAIESLGLPSTGEIYRLEGFDGTISEFQAVRATLVFSGKTFRGRYLPVDSEVGVIGRNVLNQIKLLFDGPALTWTELP